MDEEKILVSDEKASLEASFYIKLGIINGCGAFCIAKNVKPRYSSTCFLLIKSIGYSIVKLYMKFYEINFLYLTTKEQINFLK